MNPSSSRDAELYSYILESAPRIAEVRRVFFGKAGYADVHRFLCARPEQYTITGDRVCAKTKAPFESVGPEEELKLLGHPKKNTNNPLIEPSLSLYNVDDWADDSDSIASSNWSPSPASGRSNGCIHGPGPELSPTSIRHGSTPQRQLQGPGRRQRSLYIDGSNQADFFFLPFQTNHAKSIIIAMKQVKNFCRAAKRSGWSNLVVFIDTLPVSQEASQRWRERRRVEIINGKKNMPHGMSTLLGEMFHRHGSEVRYCVDADKADTLASHAQLDSADVLSKDSNFLRYEGSTFKVFHKFELLAKRDLLLKLLPSNKKPYPGTKPRKLLLQPRPITTGRNWLSLVDDPPTYLRAAPTPLLSLFQRNPHGDSQLRRLRQALYYRMGLPTSQTVLEEFPEWDVLKQEVVWTKEDVQPDQSLCALLDEPLEALKIVFPPGCQFLERPAGCSSSLWINHVLALQILVFELCCLTSGASPSGSVPSTYGSSPLSLLDLTLSAAREVLDSTKTVTPDPNLLDGD